MEIPLSLDFFKDLVIFIGVPIVRSVGGWAKKALVDNRVTRFERRQLYQTIISVGLTSFFTYVGLSKLGVPIDALGASAIGFILDRLFGSLKDTKPVR